MNWQDQEIVTLKATVNHPAALERPGPDWQLDVERNSSCRFTCRRGPGEIVIVMHDGHAWWDPLSETKGAVFDLAQRPVPGLDFGAAQRLLGGFTPTDPRSVRAWRPPVASCPVIRRWERRPPLSLSSPSWLYLTGSRSLPESILAAAVAVDAVREGPYGSAWFSHRDATGAVAAIEMQGDTRRMFSVRGVKTMFHLPGGPGPLPRLAICKTAIDALSLAALEHLRHDTLYAAITGDMSGLGSRI